ncbi:MAG: aminopeptidase P family protein [Thermodesulfobacteriota bacterium]|nr:aminopeptidase P family protein [Thermodesulfobacteriota bacterium]
MIKTIENRINILRKILSEKNFDTFMILVEENRRYLSGFTGEDTGFDESAGALFITSTRLILATDSRYELQARQEAAGYEIVCYKKGLVNELSNILNALKTKKLGFESKRLSHMQYNKITEKLLSDGFQVQLVETEDIVESLRITKEEEEIKDIKKALFIAESAFRNFIANNIMLGMTEKEAAWEMEKGMRETGADSISFPIIVASGPNSALPHAIPGNRKINKGEPILFDWGARINGYCSDISRTVVIGKPDETFLKVYETVLNAQNMAIDAIRPGISSRSVDKIARDYIEKMGFKGKFGHGLGHGTGLAIHEYPGLNPIKDTKLDKGMVFTIEPGIYIPGWGGVRLENMVVVRENRAEALNSLDCTADSA